MSDFFHQLTDPFYQTLALLGLFILLFGLVSLFVKERLYLTEGLVAVIFGIIFGPFCIPVITPRSWFSEETFNRLLMEFARIIVSLQVMAVGLCTPYDYVRKEWLSIAVLIGPTMVVMWMVASLSVFLVMRLGWWESMMIGACLAPTDPVLANAVIKGKFANRYIPGHLRNLLAVESGANDGLGFPMLMLPVFITLHAGAVGPALQDWVLRTWLYEIALSIVIGLALGFGARLLLEKSEKYRLIDKESFLVYAIALALSISGLVALISSDDLLSVFIAGMVFAKDDQFHQATKDAHFQEVLDQLFNITFFVFLGASFPWSAYYEMGLAWLFLTAFIIVLLRRLPFVMAAQRFIPQLRSKKEAFFVGWFGPMGVGAIFFALLCQHQHPPLDPIVANRVFVVVSFVVFTSIVIHGITVPITHISLKTKAKRKQRRLQKQTTLSEPSPHTGIPLDAPVGGFLPTPLTLTSGASSDDGFATESESTAVSASHGQNEHQYLHNASDDEDYDPYADTMDLRGMDPEEAMGKLYGHLAEPLPIPSTTGANAASGVSSTDNHVIELQWTDTYASVDSSCDPSP